MMTDSKHAFARSAPSEYIPEHRPGSRKDAHEQMTWAKEK